MLFISCNDRGNKTRVNRQFRKAVLNQGTSAGGGGDDATYSDVSRLDVETAIVTLQLETLSVVRLCKDRKALAEYIFTLTKALAEAPHRCV